MKRLFWLILIFSIILNAYTQDNRSNDTLFSGIHFENTDLKTIFKKAKEENKYLFIDCFASWCLPCKKMEKEVFNNKAVGDFINANFVSIRLQMDTSKTDDYFIKSWYHDAHEVKKMYGVKEFPTYLFFSPKGKIVHRFLYALSVTDFLEVARNALTADKQYYSLLDRYTNKNIDKRRLDYLATVTKQIGQNSLAKIIAKDFLYNYLNKLPEKSLLQKKHFDFLSTFPSLLRSDDNLFKYMYTNGSKVDEVMNRKGFAQYIIGGTITKEEITPKLGMLTKPSVEPEWTAIVDSVQRKYGKWWADKLVLDAQLGWYQQKKDISKVIKYKVKQFDNYGLDTAGVGWAYVNNFIWNYVFAYCNDKDTLNKAAKWMELIIKDHPDDHVIFDTYANVLYKAGRTKEAIFWEEKAIDLEDKAAQKEKREADKSFKETLDKMRNGIPTWGVADDKKN